MFLLHQPPRTSDLRWLHYINFHIVPETWDEEGTSVLHPENQPGPGKGALPAPGGTEAPRSPQAVTTGPSPHVTLHVLKREK